MHARVPRFPWRLLAVVTAVGFILESPGCGGVVETRGSGTTDGGAAIPWLDGDNVIPGAGGNGGDDPGSTPVNPGGPNQPAPAGCGDGALQADEQCDGKRLHGETCNSVTMGAMSSGTLRCTSYCTFDTSSCTYVGGAGGFVGAGGMVGTGGGFPIDPCVQMGGVPDPSDGAHCLQGAPATKACTYYYELGAAGGANTGDTMCGAGCGCAYCASSYTACVNDKACRILLDCAERVGCASATSCQNSGCGSEVMVGGGPGSYSSMLADVALGCLVNNGCKIGCY